MARTGQRDRLLQQRQSFRCDSRLTAVNRLYRPAGPTLRVDRQRPSVVADAATGTLRRRSGTGHADDARRRRPALPRLRTRIRRRQPVDTGDADVGIFPNRDWGVAVASVSHATGL